MDYDSRIMYKGHFSCLDWLSNLADLITREAWLRDSRRDPPKYVKIAQAFATDYSRTIIRNESRSGEHNHYHQAIYYAKKKAYDLALWKTPRLHVHQQRKHHSQQPYDLRLPESLHIIQRMVTTHFNIELGKYFPSITNNFTKRHYRNLQNPRKRHHV